MAKIFPGDQPTVLAQRTPPLSPIEDTPNIFFDDKMAVINASLRGGERGIALPLLLDLGRKPALLHDQSVSDFDALFNPTRGAKAPHPFYIQDKRDRDALTAFLKSLTTK